MVIMFLGVLLIFLNALTGPDGRTWLKTGTDWLMNFNNSVAVSSIILLIVVVGFMYFVVQGADQGKKTK
jgi:choline-glycine betaine transporter